MRNAFAAEMTSIASIDKRIVLLSGDIGNRLFDNFKKNTHEQFFNCGVAEANMISLASGMALCGLRPIAYTITPFITARCFEQIKVDMCFYNVPVIIVGVGGGLSYAELGATHHACEDIALMRVLPNMTVICPADPLEVRLALQAAVKHEGPVYIRLGKKGEPMIHKEEPDFIIGKGIVIQRGEKVCLLSTGSILPVVMEAAVKLEGVGIKAQVVHFHTVKPLDEGLLADIFTGFNLVVAVEEHSLVGGFSSGIAEWRADQTSQQGRLMRIGVADKFFCEAGKQKYARKCFGLASEDIAEKVLRFHSVK